MYAAGGEHPLRAPSQRVLERVEDGELDAVISVEVVQEIVHRYLAIRRPDLAVTGATAAMDLFAPVLPLTHAVMRRLPALARDYPKLAARDLIHVAVCQHEGIAEIISPDRGFDTVAGLRRIDPAEMKRSARMRHAECSKGSGGWSRLDEARRAEVTVERQRLPDALSSHDGEARGIDERVGALVMAPKPGPRLALGRLLDMHHGEPVGRLDRVQEANGRGVPVAPAQERPCLADDVVRRQHRLAGRPQPDGDAVVGIIPKPERHPVGGIDEPHEP